MHCMRSLANFTGGSRASYPVQGAISRPVTSQLLPRPVGRRGQLRVCAGAEHLRPPAPSPGYSPRVQAAIFTGTYALVFGLALLVAPKPVFGLLFNPESVPTGWIRVGGVLFATFGWQYLGAALGDKHGLGALGFYRATVWSRACLAVVFSALVALGESPAGLLVLAGLNAIGAASMHLALGRGAAPPAKAA